VAKFGGPHVKQQWKGLTAPVPRSVFRRSALHEPPRRVQFDVGEAAAGAPTKQADVLRCAVKVVAMVARSGSGFATRERRVFDRYGTGWVETLGARLSSGCVEKVMACTPIRRQPPGQEWRESRTCRRQRAGEPGRDLGRPDQFCAERATTGASPLVALAIGRLFSGERDELAVQFGQTGKCSIQQAEPPGPVPRALGA